ncbi:FAD/NAD(P)-binding protein [Brevibacterium otitidis]|uniref:FAD/NAD(P)-binding protein n=1 Tax=Brevibacterium otitidis TaxID=53364 RepID=A0ABV5X2Y2_9MICO|nr:FAD/NAD(P)-binding domain-containing protein [Brevibacterium otitidis]BFF08620.1 FAD/NAD(P)-binding domain-containing protein [Brevibacterium otitidis]
MNAPSLRVAIVGGGPKGLYALESLSAAAHERTASGADDLRLHVDIYEEDTPGAGRIWRTDQPEVFILNISSAVISAWPPARSAETTGDTTHLSFAAWAETHAPEHRLDAFPPRAVVGEYLAWAFTAVCAELPAGMTVTVIPERVRRLLRSEAGWLVEAGRQQRDPYAEVLLATGHARRHTRPLTTRDLRDDTRTLSHDDYSTVARISPGQRVLTTGAALTFIDFALMVSEHRRGHFERNVVTGDLLYRACGAEPVLLPTCRSGRFYNAKPPSMYSPAEGGERQADLDELIAGHAAALADDATPAQAGAVLRRCAVDILAGRRGAWEDPAAAEVVAAVDETAGSGWGPGLARSAKAALERSVLIARGLQAPDAECALGQAWTGLLPRIRQVLSYRAHDPQEWAEFLGLRGRLMRFAEGPPLANAEKLLALIRSGVIDLEMMSLGPGEEGEHVFGHPDLHVLAVLAPPGAVHARSEVIDSLIAEGIVAKPGAQRGIQVTETLQLVGADGQPVPGLSALGRATEDWTLGNDTLDRAASAAPEVWAARVAAGLR